MSWLPRFEWQPMTWALVEEFEGRIFSIFWLGLIFEIGLGRRRG